LGIDGATWQDSPQAITAGGIGLSAKTEDIAKFGQLYLQGGIWQDKRILHEAWVDAATSAQILNSDGVQPDWSQGYGYQFWRCRNNAFRGDGVFGQYCVVMPEQDAVLAITGGVDVFDMQQPLNLVWDILLPAMQPDPLAPDGAAQDALSMKLSNLRIPPVRGQASSPIVTQISGQTYVFDPNEMEIETITLSFDGADCSVTVKTATGEETIPCGYDKWQQGQPTALFRQPLLFDRTPITTSGAWTDEQVFTMHICLYETPFCHSLVCHFDGDELLVESHINVSLDSMKPAMMTAKRTATVREDAQKRI
jgi:hypothetical protein